MAGLCHWIFVPCPGMLMASMRLNIPTVFCSGGPMEAGRWKGENADLITAMIKGDRKSVV